jgi:hypothetical protein
MVENLLNALLSLRLNLLCSLCDFLGAIIAANATFINFRLACSRCIKHSQSKFSYKTFTLCLFSVGHKAFVKYGNFYCPRYIVYSLAHLYT